MVEHFRGFSKDYLMGAYACYSLLIQGRFSNSMDQISACAAINFVRCLWEKASQVKPNGSTMKKDMLSKGRVQGCLRGDIGFASEASRRKHMKDYHSAGTVRTTLTEGLEVSAITVDFGRDHMHIADPFVLGLVKQTDYR